MRSGVWLSLDLIFIFMGEGEVEGEEGEVKCLERDVLLVGY